jgi:RNA polymerase sigma factor (sigma-70 family)
MMTDDMELLREYVRHNSEDAFAALVSWHVNLVYSVALRHVHDIHQAEEITQVVFVILARKAASLGPKTVLSAWLCRTARYTATRALTIQQRRQRREQEAYMQAALNEPDAEAWSQIAPLLDDAMAGLGKKDHDAIVLRYFEGKDLKEVGAALGTGEDTARMRVKRAVEKLRKFFAKRGIVLTTPAIAGAVSAGSVQAAPAGLAKAATAIAFTKGATAGASTLTLIKGALKLMAWTKAKTAVVIGVGMLLAAGTTTLLVERHNQAKLYFPAREPWSDAGAATPRAALQSLARALTQGKTDRAQELMQWDEKGTEYGNPAFQQQLTLMGVLTPALKDIQSFKILSVEPVQQPNELRVKIEKTFKNENRRPDTVTAKLRRVGSRWYVVGNLSYYKDGGVSMLLPFMGSF